MAKKNNANADLGADANEAGTDKTAQSEEQVQARQVRDGNHATLAAKHLTAAAAHELAADSPDDKELATKATQASEACRGHNHPVPEEGVSVEAANNTRTPGLSAETRAAAHVAAADAHRASAFAHEAI